MKTKEMACPRNYSFLNSLSVRFRLSLLQIFKISPAGKSWKEHTNIYTSTTATPAQSKSSIPTSKDTSSSKDASSESGDKFDLKYKQMKEAASNELIDAKNCPKTEPNWSSFKAPNKKKTKLLVPGKDREFFFIFVACFIAAELIHFVQQQWLVDILLILKKSASNIWRILQHLCCNKSSTSM